MQKDFRFTDFIRHCLTTLVFMAAATAIGGIFDYVKFPEANIVIVYLFFVLLVSRFTPGYLYGIAASLAATCAFNYFFTPPYYTLSVNDPTYFITFAIMTVASLMTSALTSKVMESAEEARRNEAETAALYRMTTSLSEAAGMHDIAAATVETISGVFKCRAACLCLNHEGKPENSYIQEDGARRLWREVNDADSVPCRKEDFSEGYAKGPDFDDWPICGRESMLGLLRLPHNVSVQINEMHGRMLHAMLESAGIAMDRARVSQEQLLAREETQQERYRANLLRAISHDLRTPLSGIIGTSEMLMSMTDKTDERWQLARGIYMDADWLHSLVENILSLTRLQDGRLALKKEPEAAEEVIEGAVSHISQRYPEREITAEIPDSLIIAPMNAKLVEQMLVNLLDNAVKHTPDGGDITVGVSVDEDTENVVFSVADRGSGIPSADLPNIFKQFYTTGAKGPDAQRGIGLGLAICEAIAKAHGGSISARNRKDGPGSEFIFTLPLEDSEDGTKK